jgi:uncharacterized membrane protein
MIVKIILSFISGLLVGYLLELLYTSVKLRKIIWPVFVNYQMYGLTAVFLYNLYFFIIPPVFKILLIIIFTTVLEFIVGYSSLRTKKVRLWNYSNHAFNYKGIICPLFSFYWLVISLSYYYLVLPFIINF